MIFIMSSPASQQSIRYNMFGATSFANLPQGNQGAGLFGGQNNNMQQPKPAGLFGANNAQPANMFGNTQPAPAGGLFGGNTAPQNTGGLFGAQSNNATGFMAQPTNAGGFMAQPTQGQGLFGNQQQQQQQPNATGAVFGNSNPQQAGGMFGGGNTQPQTMGGGLFGSQQPNPTQGAGLFGGQQQQQQQQQQPTGITGGLFGGNQANTGGLMGAQQPNAATGVFGQQQNAGNGIFGQQQNAGTGVFGQQQNAPTGIFGQQQNAGTGVFGQQQNPGTGVFGQQNAGTGVFGQQQNAGTGVFGQQQNAGTGVFGQQQQTAVTGAFGQQNAGTGIFGQQNNQQQQQQPQGLFGATATNANQAFMSNQQQNPAVGGNLFGAGSNNGAGIFNQQQQQQQIAPGNTGGLFNSFAPASTASQPNNIFVNNQNKLAGTSWGVPTTLTSNPSGMVNPAVGQTTMQAVRSKNTKLDQKHLVKCISALDQFNGLSKEQIRINFIQSGGQQPQLNQQTPVAVGMNANAASAFKAPTNNLFGSQQPQQAALPTFGGMANTNIMGGQPQQGTNLFGGNQAKPTSLFGATTPALNTTNSFGANAFGQNTQQQPNALFGQTTPAPNMFGQQQQPQSMFGQQQQQTQPLFGQQQQQQPQPLFGQQQQQQPQALFGQQQQQQQPQNLFGQQQQQQQQPLNLFGQQQQQQQQQPQNLFGQTQQTTTPLFGATTPQNTSLFGAQPQQGSFLGQTTPTQQTSLFPTQPTTSLFGQQQQQPQQQPGSLFGGITPSLGQNTSLFGNSQQPAQNTSLFGNSQQPAQNTSLFGNISTALIGGQPQQQPTSLFSNTAAIPQNPSSLFNQPQQQPTSLFGPSPTNSLLPTFSGVATPLFQQQPAFLSNPMEALLPQLLLQAALQNSQQQQQQSGSAQNNGVTPMVQMISKLVTNLTQKNTNSASNTSSLFDLSNPSRNDNNNNSNDYNKLFGLTPFDQMLAQAKRQRNERAQQRELVSSLFSGHSFESSSGPYGKQTHTRNAQDVMPDDSFKLKVLRPKKVDPLFGQEDARIISKRYKTYAEERTNKDNPTTSELPRMGSYSISPSLDKLKSMTVAELKKVKDVRVWNKYGEVAFLCPINLYQLDLENELVIGQDNIEMTCDELEEKPMEMTFRNFGNYRSLKSQDRDKMLRKMRKWMEKCSMQQIRHDTDNGDLVVKVQ